MVEYKTFHRKSLSLCPDYTKKDQAFYSMYLTECNYYLQTSTKLYSSYLASGYIIFNIQWYSWDTVT